ncbi:hypothetical protein M5689_000307 [Euphorbia peplus]|nr:hypothetical protein M5689_000307 [Euphorbia peplus]
MDHSNDDAEERINKGLISIIEHCGDIGACGGIQTNMSNASKWLSMSTSNWILSLSCNLIIISVRLLQKEGHKHEAANHLTTCCRINE